MTCGFARPSFVSFQASILSALIKVILVLNLIRILDPPPPNNLKPPPSWSDASQTFKERGPAVCRVITTSLPYSWARYNHRLSEISPGASSTFPNFVWDVCSNRRRLFALLAWQVRIILCPCHLQRHTHTQCSPSRAISGSGKPSFDIAHLHLVKSVMPFKSIMSTDHRDWYWQEGK